MTVCIAALYGNRAGAVLASDQMVTAHVPIGYEFEHQEITKITRLVESPPVYALAAGDVLLSTDILNLSKERARQQHVITAAEVVEILRSTYQELRLLRIAQEELEPRGLSLNSFYSGNSSIAPAVVQMIDQAMVQKDAGVEFIVAGPGVDGYTIHAVTNPGLASDFTPMGYCAIGSGSPHALYSLIEAQYKQSLGYEDVEKLVRAAKQRSEVAPGVGSLTQVQVVAVEDNDEHS